MSILEKLFQRRKLSALEKMGLEQLENEKISLETQQEQFVKKVNSIEKRKNDVILKAKGMKSDLEKKSAYVEYKQLDQESKSFVAQHNMISKNIRVLGSLIHIKRKERLIKEAGVWSLIEGVPVEDLESFLIRLKTQANQADAKAQRLLEVLGDFEEEAAIEQEPGYAEFMAAVEKIPDQATDEELESLKREIDKTEEPVKE
jgi:hypothetical protein